MNRAERRRRGLTRSRMTRTGSLASAGVLLSVGLFGAYTGNPRIQRAYASPGCTSQNAYPVTVDDSLIAALNDPTVTCIEIDGTITLNADLPVVNDAMWGYPRETEGLSIFGTGDDTIVGGGHQGPQIELTTPSSSPIILQLSHLTMTGFQGFEGAAFKAFLDNQSGIADVDIDNVTGMYNQTDQSGAAINVRSMTGEVDVTVTDSSFSDNVSRWGGAVYVYGYTKSTTTVADSTFTGNEASAASWPGAYDGDGGALWANSGSSGEIIVNIDRGTSFVNNEAEQRGGAIFSGWDPLTPGSVNIAEGTIFTGNAAGTRTAACVTGFCYPAHGGAIFTASSVTVTGTPDHPVAFAYNSTTEYGGAIYSKDGADITYAMFQHNTAKGGGAVYNWDNGMTITHSTIANNTATSAGGGGVYSGGGTARLYNSAIVDNTAYVWYGGGISVVGGPLVVENSFIGGNYATDRAGGIYMQSAGGDVDLRFSTVYDNSTGSGRATEIYSRNITSTMSVVGSRTTGDVWEFSGTLDDSYSVSTSDDTLFADQSSGNVLPGTLGFGSLNGTAPGQLGLTPSAGSPLALAPQDGYAPLFNPVPLITSDQRGFARVAPFTIGARQALTINSVTPSSGDSSGGELITIHGSAFTGATTAAIGGAAVTNLTVVDDTTITGTAPAGTVGDADVTVADASGTATLADGFTFVGPTPNPPNPNPPAPAPATPASAPRDIRAQAGVESAEVTWLPPASTGTFPVTSYQAVASPGGQSCLVAAPSLTCTITGLTAGTPYTVTARALSGAGWSEASAPSSAVVPLAPEVPTILITSSRDRTPRAMVRIDGTTTGLVGAVVTPYVRLAGKTSFMPGANTPTVNSDGTFVWQRRATKRFTVYFMSGDVRSNRLVIRPE